MSAVTARQKFSRGELSVALLSASVPVAVKLLCYPEYPGSDDAFIHLSVVRNIVEGHGWSIQPGAPVNVSTSPLFTMVLAGLASVGLQGILAGQILSMLFAVVALLCLYQTCGYLGDRPLVRVTSAILAAFEVHLWRWTGVVMETTMTCLFISLAFSQYYGLSRIQQRSLHRSFLLGLIIGCACLVRPELGILLPSFLFPLVCKEIANTFKVVIWILAGFLVVIGAWSVFAYLYFGTVIPTTFYAKTSSFHWWNIDVAFQIWQVIVSGSLFAVLLIVLMTFFLIVGGRAGWSSGLWGQLLPAVLFPMTLLCFYLTKTTHLQGPARYCLPALWPMPIVVSILGREVSRSMYWPRVKRLVVVCLLGQVALSLYVNEKYIAPVLLGFKENYWQTMRSAAAELAGDCRPGERVLVEADIGIVSYENHGQCSIADGGGLASPELQGLSLEQQIERAGSDYVLESLGRARFDLSPVTRSLIPVKSWAFRSHAVANGEGMYFCNLYRVERE